MKFFISIIFLCIPFLFLAQTKNETNPNGYNKFYYENGILSSEGYMKDGKADGYWKNYYENGKIKNEGNRKNFQLDSLWKFYNEKGKLTKTFYYKEGKKNGFIVTYDTAVKVNQKENYLDNIKSGNSYLYYPSGKVKQVIPFVNNKADGWSYEYNQDSVIITTTLYKLGFIERTEKINRVDEKGNKQGIWKDFYPDGKVKSESRYKNNEIDGYVKVYTSKGDLKNITKFDNGKKVENPKELVIPDDFKAYFENGNVRYEGSYLNKLPIGTHYYYRLSKQICDSITVYDDTIQKKILNCQTFSIPDSALVYEDGYLMERGAVDSIRRKKGVWLEYHLTGELKGKGNYKDNFKTGDWMYYYPNGKIEQQGKYSKTGLPTGEWKWYHENGNLRIEENYRSGKRDGVYKEYLEDGKLITSGEYSDDLKEGMWNYEIANYKEEGNYRMGEPDSIWKAYYVSNKQLLFTGNFITGDPVGKHVMYYENGKTMCTGNYEGGMKQGNWKYFEETGELIISIDYENDIERKWNNVVILPTYEESLRAYEGKQKMSAPGK
jgi:antitoxin component YwqK of YwqJK toxin-antitoxin module